MPRFRPRLTSLLPVALLALVLLPAAAGAQGFHAVHSKNGLDVWAVGDGGAWSRSFDGGATWTAGQLTTARPLRGVAHQGHTVIVVADSGQVFRSTDNGISWARTVLAGTPHLKAVEMPAPGVAILCGANETILRSEDDGASWTPQGPGGPATLHGLRFPTASDGWAVGTGGRVLATTNGGANWNPVAVPTAQELFAVDASGLRVWIVGAYGLALRSTNGGGAWTPLDLRMELPLDVRGVRIAGTLGVTLTGGGGFIRSSADDGMTWSFASHPLIAATSDYFAFDSNRAWAVSARTKAVVRTGDGGATWSLPTSTGTTWDWQLKRSAAQTIRGMTFSTTPQNRNSAWAVMGNQVFKSVDRGDSWTQIATIPGGVSKTNSFYVSPRDSMKWVAAVGAPDSIARTTNGGATWTKSLGIGFTEYGMPLEMNPDRPDTLLFGPEDGRIWMSPDFGATWSILSNPGFRSPCDIVISPDNDQNVVVGDGVTSVGLAKIWQSEDGALSFADRYTSVSSETPTVWSSRLGNNVVWATNWSSGGVWRSLDFGKNWSMRTSVSSAWGGATATDDPKLVVYNRYAGSPNYVSTDGGETFVSSSLTNPGSGYAMLTLDRSTILDMHSGGIFKLAVFYTVPTTSAQSLSLTSPDGGESWVAGTLHAINWTATNLPLVAIEWRTHPSEPWLPIAVADGGAGSYAWYPPAMPTTTAQVRVRDAGDSSPADQSSNTFTILAPAIAVAPVALAFGAHPAGSATLDTLRITNTGTSTLTVSSIGALSGTYQPGRSSLVLAPGASDTVGVTFSPPAPGSYPDTLHLVNDAGSPVRVPLSGSGVVFQDLTLTAPDGGESWNFGSQRTITWQSGGVSDVALDYRTGEAEPWIPLVASTPAAAGAWLWTIPNAASDAARVRVREVGGGLADSSDATFAITVPQFLAAPDGFDFGLIPVGYAQWDTLHVENTGTATVHVSAIASDNAAFWTARTTLELAPGQSDSLSVHFLPGGSGPDSATISFTSDAPGGVFTLLVRGTGHVPVGVGDLPRAYALSVPRPNPFSGETSIAFALPEAADVALEVFDLGGRRVALLARGRKDAGQHAVSFRPRSGGAELPSGVYFVRLVAGPFARTHKLLYMAP
jgi:photosystem II stability/assembly factor-like uncharacterized protein